MTSPILEVTHLTKAYRGRPALRGLSLSLQPGQIVGPMGDNGSGKTTLLKILAGVLADWEGTVSLADHAPGPASKQLVSFLPDASFLPDSHRPADSISQFSRFFADFDEAKAREMVDFFGLPWDRSLKEMSKGMREKLQISLAMSRRARTLHRGRRARRRDHRGSRVHAVGARHSRRELLAHHVPPRG